MLDDGILIAQRAGYYMVVISPGSVTPPSSAPSSPTCPFESAMLTSALTDSEQDRAWDPAAVTNPLPSPRSLKGQLRDTRRT